MDEKDWKILEVLKDHGEYTVRQIAKKTLLPSTTINNRIRKMRREKVIEKYTIVPNYDKVGRGQLIYVLVWANLLRLKDKKRTQYDIVKELSRFEFVERADIVSGGADIIAIVRVENISEYDKVLLRKIQTIDGIEKTQSVVVIH